MKVRNSFVSNSSSSSFIVRRDVRDNSKKRAITPKQDTILKKRGFRKTMMISSDAVPPFYDEIAWDREDRRVEMESDPQFRWNWCYEITCNQDEVVMFLIENKIPFTASIHYGHYTWIYTPELNRLIIATNLGRIIEMYGDMEDSETSKVKEILKASEWLAKEKKFWGKQVK